MTQYQDKYNNSYAVIVGIDNYRHPRLRPLGNAEEDAQNIANVLSNKPYNFQVNLILGETATRKAITQALSKLPEITNNDDRVIFYFAGHGFVLTDQEGKDVGYIACADTDPYDLYDGLELDQITGIRRFSKAKHIAFILDTCFSGAALGLTRTAIQPMAIEECYRHKAYQILTAGAVEVVSDALSMTRELVNALRDGIPDHSGSLTFGQIGEYVRLAIRNQSNGFQTPFCEYLQGSGKGEMVLMTPSPLDLLPNEIRLGLTHSDPLTRRFAITEAQRLIGNTTFGETVRSVLETIQVDDPDREVRRRALEVLRNLPSNPPEKSESNYTTEIHQKFENVPKQKVAKLEANGTAEIHKNLINVLRQRVAQLNKFPSVVALDPIRKILHQQFEWRDISEGWVTLKGYAGKFDVKPFKIATYPISYAQFQVFIDDPNGFRNDSWWEGLPKRETISSKQKLIDGNLPRDNVTWYDAVSFCHWLSAKVGYEVRLPTEWEWQWAAQGSDGRLYPWGNEYIQGYANINEKASDIKGGIYLEKSTPILTYPNNTSPFGVRDMAGNVWEWCLNEFDNPSRTKISGNVRRVIRGGSWRSFALNAQINFRRQLHPNNFRDDVGFRVVGFPSEQNHNLL
jgi:hypothetical protein